ncbi:hypothetical protein TNIN_178361 [Trichonephila inaurata madagascariensis]|uniref:Uncharacterized protein n=1 Tax=Trichonephila inaurata madagascariensis TaxID=2747483 RepID=A0A8X6X760_9ARAC|nr:hypothetical protein TNIN_178361 [Trichonephila inaurata madagascariensis]
MANKDDTLPALLSQNFYNSTPTSKHNDNKLQSRVELASRIPNRSATVNRFSGGCWLYADSPPQKILQKTPLVLTNTIRLTHEEPVLFFFTLLSLSSRLDPISVPSCLLSDLDFWFLLPNLTEKDHNSGRVHDTPVTYHWQGSKVCKALGLISVLFARTKQLHSLARLE